MILKTVTFTLETSYANKFSKLNAAFIKTIDYYFFFYFGGHLAATPTTTIRPEGMAISFKSTRKAVIATPDH